MEKNKLLKTILSFLLAFAMTFTPIFSSAAVVANAVIIDNPVVADQDEKSGDAVEEEKPESTGDEEAAPAEEEQPSASEEQAEEVKGDPSAENGEESVKEEAEEEAKAEEEKEEEATKTEYIYNDPDGKFRVTATLSDAKAVPDKAELKVKLVSKDSSDYNYKAYMDALNKDADIEYDETNTLLYDVAFMLDGEEVQPTEGKVSVVFEFKDSQLSENLGAENSSDISVIHLPLKDSVKDQYDTTADAKNIEAADVNIDKITGSDLDVNVGAEKLEVELKDFSLLAVSALKAPAKGPAKVAAAGDPVARFDFKKKNGDPDPNASVSGKYYLVATVGGDGPNNVMAMAPVEINGAENIVSAFSGLDGNAYVVPDDAKLTLIKYSGEGELPLSQVKNNWYYDPTWSKVNNGDEMGDYKLTIPTEKTDGVYVYTAQKPNVPEITINTYDYDDTTPITPDPAISGTYYIRARLVDPETKEPVAWCLQEFTFTNGASTTVPLKRFVPIDKNPFDNNVQSIDPSGYLLDTDDVICPDELGADKINGNVRAVKIVDQNNKPKNFAEALVRGETNRGVDENPPVGFAYFKGVATEDGWQVNLAKADDIDYHVALVFDTLNKDDIKIPENLYVKVTVHHENGGDTYGVVQVPSDKASIKTADDGYSSYIEIPIESWYEQVNGQWQISTHEIFTGREKQIKVELGTLITTDGRNDIDVIKQGSYINKFEVRRYPPVNTDDQQENDRRTAPDPVKPHTTDVVEIIHLNENEDRFDMYSLEELLNGGYNVVTLCPGENESMPKAVTEIAPEDSDQVGQGDAYIGCHQMGGILIRGDVTFPGKTTGVADSTAAVNPSVIGGYIGDTSHHGYFVHNRPESVGDIHDVPFYLGSSNTVEGNYVNGIKYGQELGGVWHGINNCGETLISDNFVDWDKLQRTIRSASSALASVSTRTITASPGDVVNVNLGENVTIVRPDADPNNPDLQAQNITVNIIGENADAPDAPGTVVNFKNSGDVIVPILTLNGQTLSTVETGEGMSVVWNYPNATGTVLGPHTSEFGHVIAPKALIKITAGNYSGTMVGNNAYIGGAAEGHLYPYRGGDLIGFYGEIDFTKQVNGANPNERQKFTFTLKQLRNELSNNEYASAEAKYGGDLNKMFWEEIANVKNNGASIVFDDVSFFTVGEYYFLIEEDPVTNPKQTADETKYIVKCIVRNKTEGNKNILYIDEDSPVFYKVTDFDHLLSVEDVVDQENIQYAKKSVVSESAITQVDGLVWDPISETLNTNTAFYNTEADTSVTINGVKTLEGQDLTKGQFTFSVYATDENGQRTEQVVSTGSNDAYGNIKFTPISYKSDLFDDTEENELIFTYIVKEDIPEGATPVTDDSGNITAYSLNGYIYDASEKTVRVKVTCDPDNAAVDAVIMNDSDVVSFINTKEEDRKGSLKVRKTVTENGDEPSDSGKVLLSGTYTFGIFTDEDCSDVHALKDAQDNPVTVTVDVGDNGAPAVSDEVADLTPGYYWIKEVTPTDSGATPTTDSVKVRVLVEAGKTADAAVIAEVTNNIDTDEITISKKVVSSVPADSTQNYEFTINVVDENNEPITGTFEADKKAGTADPSPIEGGISISAGTATVELQGDESVTIKGLPVGATYSVAEAAATNMTTTHKVDGGTAADGNTASDLVVGTNKTVDFTNTRDKGQLEVSKEVVSSTAGDLETEFNFTVTLKDSNEAVVPVTGTFGGMTFTDGVATFKLKGKDGSNKITATDLPAGLHYTVEEETAEGFKLTAAANKEGTIIANQKSEVSFTNTRNEGGLVVSKTVESDVTADKNQLFPFVVTLKDSKGDPLAITGTYGDMTFTDGVANFSLKNGEQKSATGLPDGTKYEVVETRGADFQFTTKINGVVKADGIATGTITEDDTSTEAYVNARKEGDLKISKEVVSPIPAERTQAFTFTITLKNGEENVVGTFDLVSEDGTKEEITTDDNGQAIITVNGGETKTVKGLPIGTDYTVVEADVTNFTLEEKTGDTGKITEETSEAKFKNARDLGNLKISKEVITPVPAEENKEFEFTIELTGAGEGISGEFPITPYKGENKVVFSNGTATITVQGGNPGLARIIEGLPVGTGYKVTEAKDLDFTLSPATGTEGTIGKSSEPAAEAAFTNTRDTGKLTVKKTVVNNVTGVDTTKAFTFKVTLDSDTKIKDGKYGNMTFENNVATFTLKHGESMSTEGLPLGIGYTVEETDHDGYVIVSWTGNTGKITKEGTGAVAECTNKKIEGKTHLEATKSINNWGKAQSFTFELTAGTNNAGVDTPMPSDAEDGVAQKTVNKGDTSLTAVFGDMVFEKAGVYRYTIKECEPDGGFDEGTTNKKDGVTYDVDPHDVVVTVTDEDGDGEFDFDIKYDESGSLVITNTYAAEGEAVIVANKVFSNWGAKESFNFTLTPVDGAPMPKVNGVEAAEVTKAATETASANFGTIKYEEADTYEYEIREEVPDTAKNKDGVTWAQATDEQKEAGGFVDKGITYDGKTHTVVVKVEDKNHDGKLTTEVKYDGEVTNAATITNEYDANGEIDLKAQKAIQGRTFQEGDVWTFTVSGPEGAEIPMPERTSVTVRPNAGELIAVDFGKIEYKLEDAGTAEEPKKYTYKITESGEINGVKNDTEKTVEVTVIDNGDGTLNITKDPADEDGPTFTNKYTSKGETELVATKDFDDWGAKESFDFTLTPVGNSPMPKVGGVEAASVTKPATQNVPAKFGEIEYTAEGRYEYIIKEEVPNGVDAEHRTKDGITYDTTEHHVFVAVTEHDPKDGELKVVVTYDPEGDTQVISNRYSAKGTADLEVTKAIEYWGGAESFGFTLTAGDNNAGDGVETPMPKVDGTVDPTAEATKADPVAKFGTITYVKPGVYNYTLTEDIPDDAENADKVKWADATADEKAAGGFVKDGITYDSAEHTVTVTVTENNPKNGKLNAAVKYDGGIDLSITNTYDAKGSTTIDGIKHMENRDFKEGDEFTFTISPVNGAPVRGKTSVTIKPTSANDADFSFGDWEFTLDDLKDGNTYLEQKEFTYTISENANIANVVNDSAETLVITVKDNKDGTLTVTNDYSKKDGKFVNTYSANGEIYIDGTKILAGREFQEGDQWVFTITSEDAGDRMPEVTSVIINPTKDNSEAFRFGPIKYTHEDDGKTYHYTVAEVGSVTSVENDKVAEKTVTVSIEDKKDGSLKITKSTEETPLVFTNTYDANGKVTINGTKTMENRDFQEGDEWSFEVVAIGENADTAPLPKNNPVTITPEEGQTADLDFGDIGFDLSDVGKTYHYEVIETGEIDGVKNDTKVHKFDITVADKPAGQKDGELIVTKTDIGEGLEFTNTYDAKGEAEIGFTKKLSTGDKPVAGKYTFELRDKDDVKIDEASNDADGKVKFAKLTYGLDDAGETFEYKIVETSPAGPGWTNAEPIDITVTVDEDEDDGKVDGVLGTTVAPDIETAEMVNNYRATGKAELFAIKDLTGRDLEREQFEFKLEKQKADGTYEEIQTVKNGNKADPAKAVFDQIEFEYDPAKKIDETGEHVYRISEIVPNDAENADGVTWANANDSQKSAGGFVKDGITYDSTAQTITLTVTDNEEGKLIVTYDGAEEFGGAVFENAYDAKGLITLEGTKSFKYGDFGGAEFTFSIYKKADFDEAGAREDRSNASGLTPVATASTADAEIDEDGVAHFTFDDIEYTLDQLKLDGGVKDEDGNYSKSYEYVVVEDIPETAKPKTIDGKDVFYDKEADIQYDGKIIDFTVDVKDDGKGELKTTKSDEEVTFDFENEKRYTNLYLTKHIDKLIGEDTAEEYVNATIVFRLTYHDPVINDDVTRDVSVMFDKKSVTAKTVEVEKIPIGTTVTVSEVYTSNYGKLDPTKVTMTEVEQGVPFYEVELKNTNTNRRTGGGAINHVAPGEEDNYTIIDRVTEASQMDQRPS